MAPIAPAGAGMPMKYSFSYAGRSASSMALNRASRSTMHTEKNSTTIQPIRECDSSVA